MLQPSHQFLVKRGLFWDRDRSLEIAVFFFLNYIGTLPIKQGKYGWGRVFVFVVDCLNQDLQD
ncbi:hypothetical protein C6500_09865 [Candidatus Poribacteria bacterium]|nr:MAG: hypothetical protein C6500_09865 [Candidatus Poribacteria bacterium]